MLRLLFCLLVFAPVAAHSQQPKLVVECSNLKGHNYVFPNALIQKGGWNPDGLTGLKIGLFANPSAIDDERKVFIQYHTAAQGWHFPNGYADTIRITGSPEGMILLVAYNDNTAEMYMFMLESCKVAVSLMRHGGIMENARLFVGDCKLAL